MFQNSKEQNQIAIKIFESIQIGENPLEISSFEKDKISDVLEYLYKNNYIAGLNCDKNLAGRPVFNFLGSLRLTKDGLDYYEKLTNKVTDIILLREERRLRWAVIRSWIAIILSIIAIFVSIFIK